MTSDVRNGHGLPIVLAIVTLYFVASFGALLPNWIAASVGVFAVAIVILKGGQAIAARNAAAQVTARLAIENETARLRYLREHAERIAAAAQEAAQIERSKKMPLANALAARVVATLAEHRAIVADERARLLVSQREIICLLLARSAKLAADEALTIAMQFAAEAEAQQARIEMEAEMARTKAADEAFCSELALATKSVLQAIAAGHQATLTEFQTEGSSVREKAVREAQNDISNAKWSLEYRRQDEIRTLKMKRLGQPIPLAPAGDVAGIVFGTCVDTGDDFRLKLKHIPHMLVAGSSGSGKSVFMHSVIHQLEQHPAVERLELIDLKGGLEFDRYASSPKVRVVWEYADVVAAIDQLVALMAERQDVMRQKGWQNWPLGRVFVVIDEYAELQNDIDAADGKDDKAIAKRLSGNLVRLARRARALGVVLMFALQKPTRDAMDSAVRANLGLRMCFRMSNLMGGSVLDGLDDLEPESDDGSPSELPLRPADLSTGRFIYYDATTALKRHLQAHIAPGVNLTTDDD